MLTKSSREERFGCLFGILAMLSGFIAGTLFLVPGSVKDGTVVIAMGMCGAFVGLFLGALVGMIISRLLPPDKR